MGFASFFGRVLFSSVFILSAWQMMNDFDTDGGPSAKLLDPKLNILKGHFQTSFGLNLPDIEIRHLVTAAIALKGVGGILFIFGSTFGASLLLIYLAIATPVLHDFYNYDNEKPEFMPVFSDFVQSLALFGALIYFLGMKNSLLRKTKKKGTKTKTN